MQIEELRNIYDQDQRINIVYPRTRREVTDTVVVQVPEDEPSGFLLYSKLSPENADDEIARQVAYFKNLGIEFEWKVYSYDQPADLGERLGRAGFEPDELEAVMVLDLAQLPAVLRSPVGPQIRRVTRPEDVDTAIDILCQVWDRTPESYKWLRHRLASDLVENPHLISLFLADADGEPSACAWTYYTDGSIFAGLWGGSTLAHRRGRGLYTGLLAARAQEALERGISYLTVDASPMSRPILEKFGFVQIGTACGYVWSPASPSSEPGA